MGEGCLNLIYVHIMAELITSDTAAVVNCFNQKELQQLRGFAYSYLSIHTKLTILSKYCQGKGRLSLEVLLAEEGFVEDRPQRIVCPPTHPSPHRVCPNWFGPAIKLNCANMALAGLEGNLGAGWGIREMHTNTLIQKTKYLVFLAVYVCPLSIVQGMWDKDNDINAVAANAC